MVGGLLLESNAPQALTESGQFEQWLPWFLEVMPP
jgi:hypothetical protein